MCLSWPCSGGWRGLKHSHPLRECSDGPVSPVQLGNTGGGKSVTGVTEGRDEAHRVGKPRCATPRRVTPSAWQGANRDALGHVAAAFRRALSFVGGMTGRVPKDRDGNPFSEARPYDGKAEGTPRGILRSAQNDGLPGDPPTSPPPSPRLRPAGRAGRRSRSQAKAGHSPPEFWRMPRREKTKRRATPETAVSIKLNKLKTWKRAEDVV